MKGYIRIGGSLALGIAVILGALYVRANTDPTPSGETAVVAATPTRTYIEATDSDGDGIKDWEESLQARVFESITTPTSTATTNAEPYVPPTTLTGKFSEAFLKGYLDDKMALGDTENPLSEEGKVKFINSAVAATEDQAQSKRYTQLDISIIPTTPEAIREYGNAVSEIILSHPTNETSQNEAAILQKALETNDPSILNELKPIKSEYRDMIEKTLAVDVPDTLIRAHLALLNAYEAVYTDVSAMSLAFEDPLLGLTRINQYESDALSLGHSLQELSRVITNNNIVYTKNEPGSFLYLFTQ